MAQPAGKPIIRVVDLLGAGRRLEVQQLVVEVPRRAISEATRSRCARESTWSDRAQGCQIPPAAAPGDREAARALDLPARLAALAAALPEALPERAALASRITALAGDSEAVEAALAALDHEALDHAERGLDEPARAELDAAVGTTLAALAGRLPPDELERSRERLRRQVLRRRLGLPVLSLFSPEAGG